MEEKQEINLVEYQQILNKKLEELNRLQHLKTRVFSISEEITAMAERLVAISKELSPATNTLKVGNKKQRNSDVNDAIDTLFKAMENGTHVTRDFIEKSYPEMQEYDHNNIMQRLKNTANVKFHKDGNKLRLYI